MADTKEPNTEKELRAGGKFTKDEIAPQEMPEQEPIVVPQNAVEAEKEKGIFGEEADNIGKGALSMGEKASEIAEILVDKMKMGFSHAYQAGAKVFDELSHGAQEYAAKYKAESEINKLKGDKDRLMTQLGRSIFQNHLEKGKFLESYLEKDELAEIVEQIGELDKMIVDIGKRLDEENQ